MKQTDAMMRVGDGSSTSPSSFPLPASGTSEYTETMLKKKITLMKFLTIQLKENLILQS